MRYLNPPHIELGFYWSEIPDHEAYLRLFQWLIDAGYRMWPEVTAVRADGGLPRFSSLALHGPPAEDRVTFCDWGVEHVLKAKEWLPAAIMLDGTKQGQVPINLEYAPLYGASLAGGDGHAIEVTASGEDLSLLQNVQLGNAPKPKNPNAKWVKRARIVDRWHKNTFREVCLQLLPDYAARRWEWSLEPPKSMAVGSDWLNYNDLYLPSAFGDPAWIINEFTQWDAWSVERFGDGVFVVLNDCSAIDIGMKGMDFICDLFKRRYGRERSSG